MCIAAGNAASAAHWQADRIQSTGSVDAGSSGRQSWLNGLSTLHHRKAMTPLNGPLEPNIVIDAGLPGAGTQVSRQTTGSVLVKAGDLDEFFYRNADNVISGNLETRKKFIAIQTQLMNGTIGPGVPSSSEVLTGQVGLESLLNGGAVNPGLLQSTKALLPEENVIKETAGLIDAEGIRGYFDNYRGDKDGSSLAQMLRLAAYTASAQSAVGIYYKMPFHDDHAPNGTGPSAGGSPLNCPRHGAYLWAHIALFWDWIVAQKLQDDVMIMVTQEFSRTPYNSSSASVPIFVKQAGSVTQKSIQVNGTDHQPVFGFMFINGRVPTSGRIGGFGNNYSVVGSNDASGTPNSAVAAYSSTQIFNSMAKRVWPHLFSDAIIIRDAWSTFQESDLIEFVADAG